jgi:hypothetical protein
MTEARRKARRFLAQLALEPGATFEQVKAAYRELAQVWHPDRHESDVGRKGAAEDRMKEINAAYTWLSAHRSVLEPSDPERRTRGRLRWWKAGRFVGRPQSRRFVLVLAAGAAAVLALASRDALHPTRPPTSLPPLPRGAPDPVEVRRFDQLLRALASRPRSYYVRAPHASVRSLPGGRGDVVSVLHRGERVRGVRSRGGWIEVARPGTTDPIGWVTTEDLGSSPPETSR